MSTQLGGVTKGWSVIGADGKKIGDVDEVYPTYLKLRKGLIFKKDIYVPNAAVRQLRGDEVHLDVPESEIEALGWDTPPFATEGRPAGVWTMVQRIPPDREIAPLIDRVFSREALRIPVRGERVLVEKTPVITGEVAITKEQTVERTEARASVRKLEVEVEEHVDERIAVTRRDETRTVERPGERT